MERIKMGIRNALLRVREGQQATREVRPGVARQLKDHRFGTALDPNPAAHNSLHAVINLTAHHTVVNAKSHAAIMHHPQTGDNGLEFSPLRKCGPAPRFPLALVWVSGRIEVALRSHWCGFGGALVALWWRFVVA